MNKVECRKGWLSGLVANDPVSASESLELAIARGFFSGTGNRVIGEQKRGEHATMFVHTLVIDLDVHALFARPHAGCGQHTAADVHHAHAAFAHRPQARMVAESGYGDAGSSSRIPDRCAVRHLDLTAI